MDLDRRDVDGRSGNRRSAEDPTLLVGRAAVEAISNSSLMANVRELSTKIVKGMESSLGESALRVLRKGFITFDMRPTPVALDHFLDSQLRFFRRIDKQLWEAGELLAAMDAFQRG